MLPLGLRTLEKIEKIIDQELKAIGKASFFINQFIILKFPLGSQKLALPLLLSAENWKKSGRWNASRGEVCLVLATCEQ